LIIIKSALLVAVVGDIGKVTTGNIVVFAEEQAANGFLIHALVAAEQEKLK